MKDESEQSNPSTGSVGEPLAFAVMQPDSYVVVHSLHSAFAMRDMCGGGEIVPLYRQPQPTLTGAEREALEYVEFMLRCESHPVCRQHTDTLRGLLKRIGWWSRNTQDQQPRTKEAAHMSDDNERSVASAGSVASDLRSGAPSGCGTVRYDRGPVAWAVMPRNSDYCVTLSTRREASQKAAERKVEVGEYATMDDIAVVPLYRQPQYGVVRLPPLNPNGAPGWNAAIGAVREALADAGVDWDTE